ncbi:uncharacterized protein LOC125668285 [Ostrea edulis]|uniref:uncharacterized protein LOC125668285 n=1 Tax=Ostrea edulis TaxID=37623 RepID=UPI0024AFEE25|nr:uncharacterized protein LOC125668285 [Ostrea edulis]
MNYRGFGYIVDSCPRNKTEFTDSAARLHCSVHGNGWRQYVCVPNTNKSAIVEFCNTHGPEVFEKGYCLEVSDTGFLHPSSCASFKIGCPSVNYNTSELYKYPACHQINTEDKCYLANEDCGAGLSKEQISVTTIAALFGVFLICGSLYLIYRERKNNSQQKQARRLRAMGEYYEWKTDISDQFTSLSGGELSVLFCFLCSDSSTPDFTDKGCLDILNVIREWMYRKSPVTSVKALRTLDRLRSRGFLWSQDGVHITEDVKNEIMHCISRKSMSRKRLGMVYFLSSFISAERYLRSMKYDREFGEKCVISNDQESDSLLIRRLQMNILTHVTMEDTNIFDEVSHILNIPISRVKEDIIKRKQFLEELKQNRECVQYRGRPEDSGGSQDNVQHVEWLWRSESDARPDIVRSCIGLHPHWDIYIINNTAYRKHSKYHGYPRDVKSLLYSLLLVDEYTVKINGKSHKEVMTKIRERYFIDTNNYDINLRNLPEDIIRIEDDCIAFQSDDIRHDVMYAFVTECLVTESDLEFFLTTASCHVISEYCRSFWHKISKGERCLFLPKWTKEMYNELFIGKLQLDIITHCEELDEEMQEWISELLNIPREILKWNYAARRRYAECAKKGTRRMHRARAMIVGCAGAGKSTLLKRLQKRSLDELKQIKSTIGLEVHEDLFEISPESDFLTDLPAGIDKEGKQLLSIMDFGGQCAYYACHQVYLSRRAFYLLVLNMSKRFDEKVDPSLCDQEGTMFTDWTYGGYMLFWLKSVHTYCDNDAPVIIVGTHLDKAVDENSNKFYDRILEYLQHDKQLRTHLARDRCFVLGFQSDGSSFTDTLSDLEKCIVSIAKQSRWLESIPIDWAMSEIILRELRKDGEKMISVKTLSQKCFGDNEEKCAQISDILKFYHDIGVLLHFDASNLSKNVIIDIQWFVDSFKNIITDPNHVKDLVDNKDDWCAFNENGQIQDELLTNIWKSQQFEIKPRVKEDLLQYMERLGLIYTGKQAHYIPCMNKLSFGIKEEQYLQCIKNKTSVLVFRFDFLPYFFYFRLVVACLTKTNGEWVILKDGGPRLFKNLACFLYKRHIVALAVNKYSIQLQVFQPDNVLITKDVTLEIRDDVERLLNDLTSNFHKKIVYSVGYQCSEQEVFHEHDDCFVKEDAIHGKGDVPCPKHGMQNRHILKESTLLFHWIMDVLAEPTGLSIDELALSEPDMLKFTLVMGKDFELIAKCLLQISQNEIDILMKDNESTMVVIHKIFLKWRSKLGNSATLGMLEKSLQDAEKDTGTSLDWDVFSRAKKSVLENIYPGSAHTMHTDLSTDETVLSEPDMLKFTLVMGNDFELIAKYLLQLSQNEIDILKKENKSKKTMIHIIFRKWRSKLGNSATLEKLEKSLKDAERDTGVSLDWDIFRRAKEDILKNKK